MKNNFFDKFTPKETKFFPLLIKLAEVIDVASGLIVECVQLKKQEDISACYRKIKEQEHLCDHLQHQIFETLNSSFVTPFDREDINNLSSKMDDVTDYINSCAKRMMLYKPKTMPESATQLAELVRDSAQILVKAMTELNLLKKNPTLSNFYCKELDAIEHKADDVYEHFLIDLFENEKDAIEVIKLKDILHELERATDAAKSVGNIIKTIIVKYS